jgi:hypothetical protein
MCQLFHDFCDQIVTHHNSSLCVCKGCIAHLNIRDSKSSWLTTNKLYIILPVTVKLEHKTSIWETIYQQCLSQWCHMTHQRSGQCATWIGVNDSCHTVFLHTSNCITLRSDQLHMVEILKIAYGTPWKLRRMSWIWNRKGIGLQLLETSGWNLCRKLPAKSTEAC